jgi:hypothetical protein
MIVRAEVKEASGRRRACGRPYSKTGKKDQEERESVAVLRDSSSIRVFCRDSGSHRLNVPEAVPASSPGDRLPSSRITEKSPSRQASILSALDEVPDDSPVWVADVQDAEGFGPLWSFLEERQKEYLFIAAEELAKPGELPRLHEKIISAPATSS